MKKLLTLTTLALALGVGDEVQFQRAAAERGDLLPGGAASACPEQAWTRAAIIC